MANSITSIFNKATFSAINELTGVACWKKIRIKDVEVNSSSLNTSNPIIEEQATDASSMISLLSSDINALKIIQPTTMQITALCTDLSSIEGIISIFNDTQSTLTITTKGITAKNMAVVSVEIEQSPDMMSAARVIIELEQAVPVGSVSSFSPSQSSDESSSGVSVQTPPSLSTTASGLYSKVSNFIGKL
jgi:hypothetical protein